MNLVIGNTSQLSYYFPKDYVKVSSRNINLSYLKSQKWDSIYATFADSRTFVKDSEEFYHVNVEFTLKVINELKSNCRRLVWYSTADLWNDVSGYYDITTPFEYKKNDYATSKCYLTEILKNKQNYPNVVILYPVNFNSIYRKPGFLFYNIFQSIINKTSIEVDNLEFYREMVHPKYVVERSISCTADEIIGSGRLTFISDFVDSLYSECGLDARMYVKSRNKPIFHNKIYVSAPRTNYQDLFKHTVDDLKRVLSSDLIKEI